MNGGTLRVATWNVHGMRAGEDEIARVIRAERIDIAVLQESGPRRRLRALGVARLGDHDHLGRQRLGDMAHEAAQELVTDR